MKKWFLIIMLLVFGLGACKHFDKKKDIATNGPQTTEMKNNNGPYKPGNDAFKPGAGADEDAQWIFTKAATLIGLQNYDEALTYINKYIEKSPNDGNGFFVRGFIYSQKKDWEKAIPEYKEALRLNAAHTYAYMYKGEAHLYLKQYPDAFAMFTKVIQIEPKNMHAYYNRGLALSYMEKYKEAVNDFDVALRIDSVYAPALNNRGNAKYLLGDLNGACSDWKKSMKLGNAASEKAYNHYCVGKK